MWYQLDTIKVVWMLAILSNLVFYCSELPLIKLVEQKICRQHIADLPAGLSANLDDERCRVSVVQDQVASFIGLRTAFDAIPPLLISLWYGSLAKRFGRKIVIALACTGELLNLLWVMLVGFAGFIDDVRYAWFAAAFLFVGGGQFLLYAMFGLIVVDVTEQHERAKKLAALHSIHMISSLVGGPISGLLLRHSLALTFSILTILTILRYPIILLLRNDVKTPDSTIKYHRVNEETSEETEVLMGPENPSRVVPPNGSVRNALVMIRTPILAFVFLCFFLKRIAFTSEVLMFQTVAERLHESLDSTAWLRVPIGTGGAITLLVLLPSALRYLKGMLHLANSAEVWAIRANLSVLIVGFGSFWLSWNFAGLFIALLLCGLGEGLAPSLQSLASSIISPTKHADFFALVSVIDTLSKLVGGPLMAWTFSIRGSNDESYGYCFLLSTVLFSFLLGLSWIVPIPPSVINSSTLVT